MAETQISESLPELPTSDTLPKVMLPTSEEGSSDGRTAVDNQTVRTVFIIRPDKRIGLFLTYPMATGRNFNEILRAIDSMQLTVKHKVATPANWNKGEDVIIVPAVKEDEAKKLFPKGWKTHPGFHCWFSWLHRPDSPQNQLPG